MGAPRLTKSIVTLKKFNNVVRLTFWIKVLIERCLAIQMPEVSDRICDLARPHCKRLVKKCNYH